MINVTECLHAHVIYFCLGPTGTLERHKFGSCAQGQVVWEGATADFDKSEEAIVRQFSQGSLEGPIKYL